MNIIPAILESEFSEIESKIESIVGDSDKVHIDICDGLLTSQKTWPYSQVSNNRIEENFHVKKLLNEDMGLPFWDNINYEFDLMIQNPNLHQDLWGRLGANTFILHITSFKDESSLEDFILNINSYMIDVVLAVTYDEYLKYESFIRDLINNKSIKSLQIMTIKNIGFQGQVFDNRCIDLIEKVKSEFNELEIRVDGGINQNTINKILDLDIKECVIGSAIFKSGNPRENLNYFKDLC